MMKRTSLMTAAAGALALVVAAGPAQAFDKSAYKDLATQTVRKAISGNINNVDALIKKQEELIQLGVKGCRQYAKNSDKHTKLMNLVADHASDMKKMSLDEIESAWHEGGFLKENGIKYEDLDHFGKAVSLMDAVVHPATTYILLNKYKKTGNAALLDQVKGELTEVLDHMKHI